MGADMMVMTLWLEGTELDVEKGVAAVRAALETETDDEVLEWAADFTGCHLDALAMEVVRADPSAKASWLDKIANGYRSALGNTNTRLKSRDVSALRLGPLTGYITGGMSYGDDPTTSMTSWRELFEDSQDPMYGNPYAEVLSDALLVKFGDAWFTPGSTGRVARITVEDYTAPA